MALVLPASDSLLSALDHARLHRVVAVDAAAPEQSLTVGSDSLVTIADSLVLATAKYIGLGSAKGRIEFTDDTVDLVSVLGAAVKIGNGLPTQTQAAEDLYVEGKLEVDGAIYADGYITAQGDTDTVGGIIAARAKIGMPTSGASDYAYFGHVDCFGDAVSYAIAQGAAGNVFVNAKSGQTIAFCIAGNSGLTLNADGSLTLSQNSDTIALSQDGDNAFMKWSDGSLYLKTDEGTNSVSSVYISGKGTSGANIVLTEGADTSSYVNLGVSSISDKAVSLSFGASVKEFAINDSSRDVNYRVESVNATHRFFIDAELNVPAFIYGVYAGTPLAAGTDLAVIRAGASAGNLTCLFDHYGNDSNKAYLGFRKSASDTMGTLARTFDGTYLAVFDFYGVDAGSAWARGALINVRQNGATDVYTPTNILFQTYSATAANLNQLVLHSSGSVMIKQTDSSHAYSTVDDFIIGATTGAFGMTIVSASNSQGGLFFSDGNSGANIYAGIIEYNHVDDTLVFGAYQNRRVKVTAEGFEPYADNTYYLGKNDDDTPLAWKGVILKDTTDGKYYRVEVINGTVTATDLTD